MGERMRTKKLFIFGSTGDLVRHKVMKGLEGAGIKDLEIFAIGRRNLSREQYIELACVDCVENFKQKINYINCELNEECFLKTLISLLKKDEINFFYAALPPALLKYLLKYIAILKKKGYKIKILMEKPFGENLKDALKLNTIIEKNKLKDDILISDHYMYKTPIKRLKPIEFKEIRMVALENAGLEGRTEYYETVGALGDMVQNHFLNVVFKLITKPKDEFKNFKITKYERGQYGDGKNKGYVKELGKESDTETFVHLVIKTKKRRYEFITGKAFDKKISFIDIDNKRIDLLKLKEPEYIGIFKDFFALKKDNFPTIENSILAWRIISKIKKKKAKLFYYDEDSSAEEFLRSHGINV